MTKKYELVCTYPLNAKKEQLLKMFFNALANFDNDCILVTLKQLESVVAKMPQTFPIVA